MSDDVALFDDCDERLLGYLYCLYGRPDDLAIVETDERL